MPTARARWTGTGPGQRAWPGNWRRQRRLPPQRIRENAPGSHGIQGRFLGKTLEKAGERGRNLGGIRQNEGGPFGRLAGFYREGRRILDKNTHGSFKAATKSRCPIVPVALIDSYKAFDTRSIEKMVVQVHFLEPMYYDEYKDMKTTELALEVKTRIEETIKKSGKWD